VRNEQVVIKPVEKPKRKTSIFGRISFLRFSKMKEQRSQQRRWSTCQDKTITIKRCWLNSSIKVDRKKGELHHMKQLPQKRNLELSTDNHQESQIIRIQRPELRYQFLLALAILSIRKLTSNHKKAYLRIATVKGKESKKLSQQNTSSLPVSQRMPINQESRDPTFRLSFSLR